VGGDGDGGGPWTRHVPLIRPHGAVGVVARTSVSGVQLLLLLNLKLLMLVLHVLLLILLLLLLQYVRVVERVRCGYAHCWVVHQKMSEE
jgi:hypothetical protein